MTERVMIQRFEVRGILGAGAVGTVYQAFDPQLEREVAVKVLARGAPAPTALSTYRTLDLRRAGDRATQDDLLAEARVMAKMSHPNVLPIYEVGLDHGAVFLVTELVVGCDLRTWLREPRTLAAIRGAFAEAARGIMAAHAAGIIHRDLKPDNLLIGSDGRVRVADFGLSKLIRQRGEMMRTVGEAGTPSYMAPELWRGESATVRSDVYAFATALCEALLGERVTDESALGRLRARGVDARLASLIVAGLSEDPHARPPLGRLAAALEHSTARSRTAYLAAGVGLAALAGGAWWLTRDGADAPTCEAVSTDLSVRWDPARREVLLAKLGTADDAAKITGALDREVEAIAAARVATCDGADGAQREVRARLACLDRRGYQLGALVTRLIATKAPRSSLVLDLIAQHPDADSCAAATALPGDDVATSAALHERFAAALDLRDAAQSRELDEVERAARASGEAELAARAALEHGAVQIKRAPEKARELLDRSHREALEAGALDVAVRALAAHASLAVATGDRGRATPLIEQARHLIGRSGVGAGARVVVWRELATVALAFDEPQTALEDARRGRAELAASRRPLLRFELFLRIKELEALRLLGRPTLQLARENVDFARQVVGDRNYHYAFCVRDLSVALTEAGHFAEGEARLDEALALPAKMKMPPDDPFVISTRMIRAHRWIGDNDAERGHAEIVAIIALVDASPALRSKRARYLIERAHAEQRLGRVEDALRTAHEALELGLAKGLDAVGTRQYRRVVANYATELGRFDEAARHLEAIEATEQRTPLARRDVASRLLIASRLEVTRGDPRRAEELARGAIAPLREKPYAGDQLWEAHAHVGVALVGQERWAEGLAALDEGLGAARRVPGTAEMIAYFDLAWARAAWQLGRREEARARLRTARDVLATYPGELISRAIATKLATMFEVRDPKSRPAPSGGRPRAR